MGIFNRWFRKKEPEEIHATVKTNSDKSYLLSRERGKWYIFRMNSRGFNEKSAILYFGGIEAKYITKKEEIIIGTTITFICASGLGYTNKIKSIR